MASPFAAYGHNFFSVEYRVNGLWLSLINQHFPPGIAAGQYLIQPEAYPQPEDTSGLRADLLVSRLAVDHGAMTISKPVLVFEGKGSKGDAWDGKKGIDKQLESWLAEAGKGTGNQFDCWVIGARGVEVKFWHWSDYFQEIMWKAGQKVNGHKIYDITNTGDWADVLAMLTFMAANPA